MSHFSLLVIGDDVEKQLAPFQENNMSNCPNEFLEFKDTEDENRREYENDSVERVAMPDGRLLTTWDSEFKTPGAIGTHAPPPHLQRREVPFKETYATFEAYMADWCGEEARDSQKNRYGHWHNPNAKWDWWTAGGRWAGMFILKNGATANASAKRDINFQRMRDKAEAEAMELWTKAVSIFTGQVIPSWPEIRERHRPNIDAAREEHNAFPVIQAMRKLEGMPWMVECYRELFCAGNEPAYRQKARDKAGVTFAVLKDGKWYERGQMGCFGYASNKKPQGDWNEEFGNLIGSLHRDTALTVVDCHT